MTWSSPRLRHLHQRCQLSNTVPPTKQTYRIISNDLESSGRIMPPKVGASGRGSGRTTPTAEVRTEDRHTRGRNGSVAGVRVRLLCVVGRVKG